VNIVTTHRPITRRPRGGAPIRARSIPRLLSLLVQILVWLALAAVIDAARSLLRLVRGGTRHRRAESPDGAAVVRGTATPE